MKGSTEYGEEGTTCILYVLSNFHWSTLIWIRNITSRFRHLSTKIFWILTDSMH